MRVFVGTPGDVQREQELVSHVIEKVNSDISFGLGVTLELFKGSTHGTPGLSRAQSLITPLIDQCDIFIGVLWHRFGTPPGITEQGETFESGTEEEFTRALKRWTDNGAHINSMPRIMIYFSDRKLDLKKLDTYQYDKVRKFRLQFDPEGSNPGLVSNYNTLKKFEEQVRRHLFQIALKYSPNISNNRVIGDFVDINPSYWSDLFEKSQYAYFLFMYSRTWRNTFLNEIKFLITRGGSVKIVMPKPDTNCPALQLMARRISYKPQELADCIEETAESFSKLYSRNNGSVDVRFTDKTLNHALYLFEGGGVVAMYNYRTDRSPSPAILIPSGSLYDQFVEDFLFVYNESESKD